MGKLVAIGGGEIAGGETLAIDKEIVSLTGKNRPRALFIPTASSDSREYWQVFQNVYGKELGCETDVLYLLGVSPTKRELEQKILSADLILRWWWKYTEDDETLAKARGGQHSERRIWEGNRPVWIERGVYLLVQLGS